MKVQFFQTKNEFLKPFLEGYYFLSKDDSAKNVEYLTFPNNLINVSVYQNAMVLLENHKAYISENNSIPFNSILVSNYKIPIKVTYAGAINEITFCFTPLGLNSFVPNFTTYLKNQLNNFIPFEDYTSTFCTLLTEVSTKKRIDIIESYWLSKLNCFQNSLLENLVKDLASTETELAIGDLALKFQTSRQNIFKLFSHYLGKSPSDFKKINRFRSALSKRITAMKADKNLTSLSYEALFYDQSHMVKEFKMLTGLTPKQFFSQINLKTGAGNWLFVQ